MAVTRARVAVSRAESLATALTESFLRDGNFELAGSPTAEISQASSDAIERFGLEEIFSNLSVQAVGFASAPAAEGVEAIEAIYVYTTKGTKKALNALPTTIEDVPVIVENIGRVIVKPQAATANRGQIFERGGRAACGCSCAPSIKTYSGTFGALVRKTNDPDAMYILSNNHVTADCNHYPLECQ